MPEWVKYLLLLGFVGVIIYFIVSRKEEQPKITLPERIPSVTISPYIQQTPSITITRINHPSTIPQTPTVAPSPPIITVTPHITVTPQQVQQQVQQQQVYPQYSPQTAQPTQTQPTQTQPTQTQPIQTQPTQTQPTTTTPKKVGGGGGFALLV